MALQTWLEGYLQKVEESVKGVSVGEVQEVIDLLFSKEGRRVWVIGNGGSAALANHFANDLMMLCEVRATSLCDSSNVTALGNDHSFSQVFSLQLSTMAEKGDILISISGSGRSQNLLQAIDYARFEKKMILVNIVGGMPDAPMLTTHKGHLNVYCSMPSARTAGVERMGVWQDLHSVVMHMIVYGLLEAKRA